MDSVSVRPVRVTVASDPWLRDEAGTVVVCSLCGVNDAISQERYADRWEDLCGMCEQRELDIHGY